MTEAEIRQAEKIAREHLNRCRTIEARIIDGGHRSQTVGGIVPMLCETILKLAAEAKQRRVA